MADNDKKFLDEDGVNQFAEETKKYVDKHADNADIHVTSDDKANWNGKANDADVVHKSGNETIAGVKTFTSSTVIDGSGKFYQAYASDYIKGVVPSAATYQGIRFYDDQKISTVANHITGAFELQYGTDGYNKAYVGCRNYSGTSQLNYNVGLRVPNDSTRSIDFHPSADNKINLGTSSYRWADTNTVLINGKTPAYASDLDDLVHKSGNETVNGTKTFTLAPVSSNGATTNGFFIKNTAIARNDVPTNIYHSTFRVNDKNDKILGEYCVEKSNSGSSLLNMNVRTDDSNGNQISKSLYLNLKNDGSDVSFHPSSTDEFNLGTSAWKWKDVNTVLLNGKDPAYADDLANYFPKAGGQLSGHQIKQDTNNNHLEITGGTDYSSGPSLVLTPYNSTEGWQPQGSFLLHTNNFDLMGKPDGSLTWGNKSIDVIEEQGDGYIRYSNGLQICWGAVRSEFIEPFNGHYGKTVSFPKIFMTNTEPATNITQWRNLGNLTQNVNVCGLTNSSFTLETDIQAGVYYTVFGRWK